MSPVSTARCPSCGKPASGRFCGSCGTALAGRPCPACQHPLSPGARFCGACGAATQGGAAPRPAAAPAATVNPRLLWPIGLAGVAVVVALVVFLFPGQSAPPAAAASGPGLAAQAPLPDLTGLPARVRFDTLYNRVMRAAEQADDMTAGRFAPMALEAYAELEAVDADARYHAAMIRLHTGDPGGAAVLADSITLAQPTHLFGFVIRGTVARLRQEDARLASEQAAFLKVYDAEMAAGRPEYTDHGFIINQFVTEARARVGGQGEDEGGAGE